MHGKLKMASLLVLVSLACATTVMSEENDPQKERIRIACPGIAKWEATRDNSTHDDADPRASDPALRDELIRMADRDQAARSRSSGGLAAGGAAALAGMNKIDAENLRRIREIIAAKGVPTLKLVGRKGMTSFWLLVQHANLDPALQRRVLQALSSDPAGVPPSEVALLTDRVQVNAGEAQTYGTQFHREGDKFVADTIRDPETLAQRRKKMDLMPIGDYECALREMYRD